MPISIRPTALTLFGAAILCFLVFASARAETVKVTLLGVGDIYNFQGGTTRGGFARLNAVARAERERNPNFIYVFDGDMLSPSLLSGLDKGENTIRLTNIVPFDIAVPGNHEFDFGTQNFLARMRQSRFPWAAVNITHGDGSPVPGLGGVMMKGIAKLKIALVPVAQDTTPQVSSSGDWTFADTVKSAEAAAIKARKDGADLVVGVVQADHSDDAQMIKSHLFDVLLSGDDHDFVAAYDGITAYVETSTEADYLAPVDLTVNIQQRNGRRRVTWEPDFRFIDTKTVKPDPATQRIVDSYKAELDKNLNVPLGRTVGALDSRRNIVRRREAAIGDLIADAMRAATGADIAITNAGGIRGNTQYAPGEELTRGDILTELPFSNIIVVTEISGRDIRAALENGLSQVDDGAGRFPQVSGMAVTADLARPIGHRILSVEISGKPLKPSATYRLATNDFMLRGGDGYTMLGKGKVLIGPRQGKLLANAVMVHIRKLGTVDMKPQGRIVLR